MANFSLLLSPFFLSSSVTNINGDIDRQNIAIAGAEDSGLV